MYHCIEVRGYLAFFDARESSQKYVITKEIAKLITSRNKGKTIPLVVSHVDFRVDLTIGYVTELKDDNKGLYCVGVIDNTAFLKVQQELNEDFIKYFTKAEPSPLLYLRSCLPCFSLSHEPKTLLIKHVALVDLGARRGTLIRYSYMNAGSDKTYTSTEIDFYKVMNCYSRNTIKLGPERNSLLFKDALFCGETDTEFINAGRESEKNTIKALSSNSDGSDKTRFNKMTNEQNNIGMDDALSFLNNLASALSRTRAVKRASSEKYGGSAAKKRRLDVDEPIINASQTLLNPDQHKQSDSWKQEMDDFKNQMKQIQSEFLNAQSSLFKDIISSRNQQQQQQLQHNFAPMYQYPNYNLQTSAPISTPGMSQQIQWQPQLQNYNGQNQETLNGNLGQQSVQTNASSNSSFLTSQPTQSNQFMIPKSCSGQHSIHEKQPVAISSLPGQPITPNSPLSNQFAIQQQQISSQVPQQQSACINDQSTSQQRSEQMQQNNVPEIQSELQTKEQYEQSKSAETTLIEAGMDVNEKVHLLNELFRQFIDTNFTVKKQILQ